MTEKIWNPTEALTASVRFFKALPHLESSTLTTCGGEILKIWFDSDTSELVAETEQGIEFGRVHMDVTQ